MAIDWTQIPIVQKDMYERWERFSVGHSVAAKKAEVGFTNPAVASECVYGYDDVNDRVYNTINTQSLVGLVCPDKRDANFTFDGQLAVFGGGDNDPLGIVIAYTKLPNGETHTLTVMRSLFGAPDSGGNDFYLRSPMTVIKDYLTIAPKIIAESWGILKFHNGRIVTQENPLVPVAEHNTGGSWIAIAPKGVHVKVVREGDIITVESSQFNETELLPATKLTVDLSADPDLAIFRGRSQYGFCSFSQDRVFWTGQVDHPKLATPFWLSDVHAMYGTHGLMSNAAIAAGIWVENKVDMKDVFANWYQFSRGSAHEPEIVQSAKFSDRAIPEELAFYYNEADNTIGNDIDTHSLVGFISPDAYDSYLLDTIIRSKSIWQNDPVGVVLAYAVDPDGTAHTLTAHRRMWQGYAAAAAGFPYPNAPLTVELDHLTIGEKFIQRIYGGLDYATVVPTAESPIAPGSHPWDLKPWNTVPEGIRMRVQRNGDHIEIVTSMYGSTKLVENAKAVIDLNSDPALHRFKGAKRYGFCCHSNDKTTWNATIRPGSWRKAFWMSDFGKRNNYVRQVVGPFTKSVTSAGSVAAGYGASKHQPTNTPLDVLVPLRGFVSSAPGYTFTKDMFVFGHHFKPEELTAIGLNADDGICIARPSSVMINFITASAGEVGYYIFNKSSPFSKRLMAKRFEALEMTSGIGIKFRLPQGMEDMILIPYVKADSSVSDISVTIGNV